MEISLEGVRKSYGDTHAIRSLDLKIHDGSLHFLLGPSGCGKTTALRLIAGLEKASAGKILFDGKDVTNLPSASRGVGMVFQNYALWPHMTVKQNIEYGLKLRKLTKAELHRRSDEVLSFTQLDRYKDRLPGQLSGGQQQRVALARALAIRPNVLLLDEPLSNLDAKLRLEMRENITRIHQQTKITTIYVTHDQKEALSMGTDISLMYAGEMIQSGSPRELYRRPANSFVAQFIGEANLFDGEIIASESTDKQTTVKSPLGEIRSTVQSRAGSGEKDVSIAIRPESIRVSYEDSEEKGIESIPCELKQLTYLGEQEQLILKTKKTGVTIKTALFNSSLENIRVGETLFCHIPQSSIMILPKASHLGPGT